MNCLRIFRFKMVLLAFLIFSYSITAETKKLLILGDSISAGYGIKESQNWVHLFNNSTDAKNMNLYMKALSREIGLCETHCINPNTD